MKRYKIIFSASGTGGHIFPAIAVAKKVKEPIIFICSKYGMGKTIFSEEKFKYILIPIKGFLGLSFFGKLKRAPLFILSILIVLGIFIKYRPKVIFGFGGYASFPVLFWAWILKRKYFIQEQNSIPGFVNRFFSKGAQAIFLGFPNTKVEGKKIFTGNPVREEFLKINPKEEISFPLKILIIGGSQGSKFLNETIIKLLPEIKDFPIKVYHQSGKEYLEVLKREYEKYGFDFKVFDFIKNLWDYYEEADLIICRAGALTIYEIISSGRCAILVPFKGATENHQFYNAKYLEEKGAAFLIEENERTAEGLLKNLKVILKNPNLLIEMGKRAKELEVKKGMDLILENLNFCLEGRRYAISQS